MKKTGIAAALTGALLILFSAAGAQVKAKDAKAEDVKAAASQATVPGHAASCEELAVSGGTDLCETELLKNENLNLKWDDLQKQVQLLQAQYAQAQQQMSEVAKQLPELEEQVLKRRGFKAGEWFVNWQSRKVEKAQQKPEAKPEEKK